MAISRRQLISSGVAASAGLVGAKAAAYAQAGAATSSGPAPATPAAPTSPSQRSRIVVPNGSVMPFHVKNGVKIFHITASPIEHEIVDGLRVKAWGYNGSTPGPVIEVNQGDKVRIYVTNKLPEGTSIHWHGILLPAGMDGVAGLTQPAIAPGQTFRYEFTFNHAGTFMYHPHADEMTQIALGMIGMIVVHPKTPKTSPKGAGRPVRDYVLLAHEWKIPIGTKRPDFMAMNDFNVLTFNGKAFPATTALVAQVGDLVRMRIGNLSPMDHHSIHMHGHTFEITETDGGTVPLTARVPETTVLVPAGAARVVEFVAEHQGDWPLHCHMTHHGMNQMGHNIANLIGADVRGLDAKLNRIVPGTMIMGDKGMSGMDEMAMAQPTNSVSMKGGKGPFGWIEMGGMFTLIKVRDQVADPTQVAQSWYSIPPGTQASLVSKADAAQDGIEL